MPTPQAIRRIPVAALCRTGERSYVAVWKNRRFHLYVAVDGSVRLLSITPIH